MMLLHARICHAKKLRFWRLLHRRSSIRINPENASYALLLNIL